MKKPIWLVSYESTLRARKEREKAWDTATIFIVLMLFGSIGVFFLRTGRVDLMPYLGWAGGILGLSSFLAMMLSPQREPEDEAKTVKENLARLLTTEEEIEEFDHQMLAEPKYGIEVSGGSSVEITDKYLVSRYEFCGKLSYRIAKLSEIAGSRLVATKSDAKETEQKFVIDLLNADGERLMAVWVDGVSAMERLEEVLAEACPGLVLRG